MRFKHYLAMIFGIVGFLNYAILQIMIFVPHTMDLIPVAMLGAVGTALAVMAITFPD